MDNFQFGTIMRKRNYISGIPNLKTPVWLSFVFHSLLKLEVLFHETGVLVHLYIAHLYLGGVVFYWDNKNL